MNQLFNDDCFKILPTLAEKSVDMVLLDLPYGCISSAWDCKIDLKQLWIELERVCKDKAQLIFFCTTRFGFELIASKREWFRYDMVWEKGSVVGFLNSARQPLRKHEMIYVFSKETGTYNPQKSVSTKANAPDRHPTSIIFCQRDNTNKRIHPTMKPLELCRMLIRQYTNEGDVVLDCCMGSGTSVVAAKIEKRQYIGIEMSENFYKIADYRVAHYDNDPNCALIDTLPHESELTEIDNPDPPIYSCYDTENEKKVAYKKSKRPTKPVPVPTVPLPTVPVPEDINPDLINPEPLPPAPKKRVRKTETAKGIYGKNGCNGTKITKNKKVKIVLDTGLNEVPVECDEVPADLAPFKDEHLVPIEIVDDVDLLQMATLKV
jgi:site-specific DNA-methyltransferase (adenine-specific)